MRVPREQDPGRPGGLGTPPIRGAGFCCHGCGAPLVKSWTGRDPKWCSEKCRKRNYGDPCVDCGVRTAFGADHARVEEPRCPSCAVENRRVWPKEKVLDRIVEWVEIYGEPPAVPDWNPTTARTIIHDEARARRFEDANGYWPWAPQVHRIFGSWNAAIDQAGFMPRAPWGSDVNQQRRRRPPVAR